MLRTGPPCRIYVQMSPVIESKNSLITDEENAQSN